MNNEHAGVVQRITRCCTTGDPPLDVATGQRKTNVNSYRRQTVHRGKVDSGVNELSPDHVNRPSEGLTLADDSTELENLEVHILLGADFLWRIMTGEIQQGKDENEPVAIDTHFSYVLSGPISNMPPALLSRVNLSCTYVLKVSASQCEARVVVNCEDSSNQEKLNQMFELDPLGISESDSVYETFLKDVKFENSHDVADLPWREHHDTLPDNYELCVSRLKSTLIFPLCTEGGWDDPQKFLNITLLRINESYPNFC